MNPVAFAVSLSVLSGCLASETPGDCGASGLQDLVGQDSSALAAMTFPDTTRFLEFGAAMTMDFNPERLNIQYDENGIIARVWCG